MPFQPLVNVLQNIIKAGIRPRKAPSSKRNDQPNVFEFPFLPPYTDNTITINTQPERIHVKIYTKFKYL